MRRMHLAMLILGLVGVLGFTIVKVAAQPAPTLPTDKSEPVLLPATFSFTKGGAAPGKEEPKPPVKSEPEIVLPPIPAPTIELPPKEEPKPNIAAPAKDMTPKLPTSEPVKLPDLAPPMLPVAPLPELPKPSEPIKAPELTKPPMPEPIKTPELVKPPVITPPTMLTPEIKTNKVEPQIDLKPVPGAITSKVEPAIGPGTFPSNIHNPTSNRVSPGVSIETIAPESVGLGRDTTYEIVVRNNGPMIATNVKVEEDMPPGSRYLGG
jgi:uncharacterized repeat protein (TIGR01451 family)